MLPTSRYMLRMLKDQLKCSSRVAQLSDGSVQAHHNIQSICDIWQQRFKKHNISEPRISAELIIAHALGAKTLAGVPRWTIVSDDLVERINELCQVRLKSQMPVQYVIGEWDFDGMILQMEPPVLIPRPETEAMIDMVTTHYKLKLSSSPQYVLDIGCGSGAIILSLAKRYPDAFCIGIDRNKVACELTRKNSNNNDIPIHVEHLEFNQQTLQGGNVLTSNKYDLIVSNPPYIKTSQLKSLQPEISRHEDVEGALHGGSDGLDVIKIILSNISKLMHQRSCLWLETDSSHIPIMSQLMAQHDHWNLRLVRTYKDIFNKDRFCLLKLKK